MRLIIALVVLIWVQNGIVRFETAVDSVFIHGSMLSERKHYTLGFWIESGHGFSEVDGVFT